MTKAVSISAITFSENPVGTVNPTYTYSGLLSSGDLKITTIGEIVSDPASQTSPAIAANTSYSGPVTIRFNQAVSSFSLDAGAFDAVRSTRVSIYGSNGFNLMRFTNDFDNKLYQNFGFDFGENVIRKISIRPIGSEPAGFAVDNLIVGVRPEHETIANSGDVNIDNLVHGTRWSESTIDWSFMTRSSDQFDYGTGPETFPTSQVRADTMRPFTAGQQAMTRVALDMWSDVGAVSFNQVNDNSSAPGTIRFARADIDAPADAFLPGHDGHSGDVRIDVARPTAEAMPGSYEFYVFIHEVGHALGLKHPHAAGLNGVTMPAARDSHEFSIMSYRSFPGQNINNVTNADGSYPYTLMMNDIAAMQYLYGANFATKSGNTTYRFDPGQSKIFETVWDGGGIDTYDASGYNVDVSIDLRPGRWSVLDTSQLAQLDTKTAGPVLARASVFNARLYQDDERSLIENATGGSGDDLLRGNTIGNHLQGGRGRDTLDGLGGQDILDGGNGNDVLIGGSGSDRLNGNSGTDYLEGNAGVDRLRGGDGRDSLHGGGGNDIIRGQGDRDEMSGGSGRDLFVFDDVSDSGPTSIHRDTIVDFTQGEDVIVISAIDANAILPELQGWTFIGTSAFSNAAGELRYTRIGASTIIRGDVDGDSVSDFEIALAGRLNLTESDFLL